MKLDPTPHHPHIVLALNLLSADPPRFHWLIFVPTPGQGDEKVQTGMKLHAVRILELFIDGVPMGDWTFQAMPFTLAASETVVAAAVIGQLRDKTIEQLVELLSKIPMLVPAVDAHREPQFTCRVWVREALRRMHGAGFIHCIDVDAMEAEMLRYGLPAAAAVKNRTFRLAHLFTATNSRTL